LAAADLFRRLGDALLKSGRAGEAVGPLRRASAFGAPATEIFPLLGKALLERKRYVAAYAYFRDAIEAGVAERELQDEIRQVESALGPSLTAWKAVRLTVNT
jgi:hypothetical protein